MDLRWETVTLSKMPVYSSSPFPECWIAEALCGKTDEDDEGQGRTHAGVHTCRWKLPFMQQGRTWMTYHSRNSQVSCSIAHKLISEAAELLIKLNLNYNYSFLWAAILWLGSKRADEALVLHPCMTEAAGVATTFPQLFGLLFRYYTNWTLQCCIWKWFFSLFLELWMLWWNCSYSNFRHKTHSHRDP